MTPLSHDELHLLLDAATAARQYAYAPYSHFPVGAAILLDDQSLIVGANVENASFGLTICAERVALSSAIAQGKRHIRAIAVVAHTASPVHPCGACRQVLHELAPDAIVLLANLTGQIEITTAQALLPQAFSTDQLTEFASEASHEKTEIPPPADSPPLQQTPKAGPHHRSRA